MDYQLLENLFITVRKGFLPLILPFLFSKIVTCIIHDMLLLCSVAQNLFNIMTRSEILSVSLMDILNDMWEILIVNLTAFVNQQICCKIVDKSLFAL